MAEEKDWNGWFRRRRAKAKIEESTRLDAARRDAAERGKEPFDLTRLEQLYTPAAYLTHTPPAEQRQQELEKEYYLRYPKVLTLQEFARELEKIDMFDGGDLDRDGGF